MNRVICVIAYLLLAPLIGGLMDSFDRIVSARMQRRKGPSVWQPFYDLRKLFSKQMLAVCYRYTGDVDAAHDVLHDGFIKIFTHFTFRGECALSTWVTRVMVTQAIDYLRKQQRFSQLVVNEEQLPDIPDEAGIAETGGRISEEMLMAFVAELPDGCRTVFNLYVFEEKSHKEIAEILHIKEHSSTSQLHRAKCLLIKRIKEYTEYERK